MQVQEDAEKKVSEWEKGLKEQELAEKRRVAPGWLDREEKILQPKRTSVSEATREGHSANLMDQQDDNVKEEPGGPDRVNPAGEELDRAFGGMGLKN